MVTTARAAVFVTSRFADHGSSGVTGHGWCEAGERALTGTLTGPEAPGLWRGCSRRAGGLVTNTTEFSPHWVTSQCYPRMGTGGFSAVLGRALIDSVLCTGPH